MRRFGLSWLVLVGAMACAQSASADPSGWSYLIHKLEADGVAPQRVARAFNDPRMPAFDGLEFSPERGREPSRLYRRFLRPAIAAAARRCRQRHAAAFEAAERAEGVPANVLAAILYVETGCGLNTGSHRIFYRLARLAMANDPANLRDNLERFTDDGGRLDAATEAGLRARARYLENTFYPEVRAAFDVADRMGVAPLDVRGSLSGAFGFPQFLPTSYLRHGVDADHDGQVSLYDPVDAAASCARYLAANGWRPGIGRNQRRQVIWTYNRSDAYIDAVLTLAARIDQPVVLAKRGQQPAKSAKRTARSSHKRRG